MSQFKSQKMKLANYFHTLRDQPSQFSTLNRVPLKNKEQGADYDDQNKNKHMAKSFRVNKLDLKRKSKMNNNIFEDGQQLPEGVFFNKKEDTDTEPNSPEPKHLLSDITFNNLFGGASLYENSVAPKAEKDYSTAQIKKPSVGFVDKRAVTAPTWKYRRCESVNLEGHLDQIVRVPRDLDSRHSSRQDPRIDSLQLTSKQNSLYETSVQ